MEIYGTSMEIDGILKGFQMPLGGNGGYYVMGDVTEIYIYIFTDAHDTSHYNIL